MSNYRALKAFALQDGRKFEKDQEFEAERHDMVRPLKHRLVEEVASDSKDKPASHGLNVEQLKAALGEKGIEIPDDAKKADLAKLLDEAVAP